MSMYMLDCEQLLTYKFHCAFMQLIHIQCVNAFVSTDQYMLICNAETHSDHSRLCFETNGIIHHRVFHTFAPTFFLRYKNSLPDTERCQQTMQIT